MGKTFRKISTERRLAFSSHKLAKIIDESDELEEGEFDDYCPACAGSGEGYWDGSSCRCCGGSGIYRP